MRPPIEKNPSEDDPRLKEPKDLAHFALRAAGVGIWEFYAGTNEWILDARCQQLLGLQNTPLISTDQLYELIQQIDHNSLTYFLRRALNNVDDGKFDVQLRVSDTKGNMRWLDFSGQAFFGQQGRIDRFGGVLKDITDHVLARIESENNAEVLRSVISSAPVGIGLFVGRDLVIEMPNAIFIDIVGKGPDIVGKSLREVMPELEAQGFLRILDEVFITGKIFQGLSTSVTIIQNGQPVTKFFNITFTPLLDEQGKTYAILDISMDVTEATKSREKLEEAQKMLEGAITMANLATWSIDATTGYVHYSERMKSWLGVDQNARELQRGIDALPDYDRDRVRDALAYAMTPESDGIVSLEYGIRNMKTGRERIINVQARTSFDERGKPIKMLGTALDVTAQRNRRLQLEEEVRQRTEELDEINEVLRVTNEELQTINGELAELNDELAQSNENLQQFAHVASHDLKEPVRKIKIFLGMIETDKETVLSERSRLFMQRVNASADRMFSMINGVLAFSTVNASEHPVEQVNLEGVMNNIIHDLDVLIAQKKATIAYHDLPRFDGVEILIYQLLSNLIINSLKFSRKDVPPEIELTATRIIKDSIPFIQLVITDNGIGFESHQSEKIFQTFARLHSKDKFEGTGLGLALCQKIVIQHGGTIRASGQPAKGAVFTILLPERQSEAVM